MASRTHTLYITGDAHLAGISMLMVEIEQEEDGRWIAEVTTLPGVMAYGETKAKAKANVILLMLRVLAERLAHREPLIVH